MVFEWFGTGRPILSNLTIEVSTDDSGNLTVIAPYWGAVVRVQEGLNTFLDTQQTNLVSRRVRLGQRPLGYCILFWKITQGSLHSRITHEVNPRKSSAGLSERK